MRISNLGCKKMFVAGLAVCCLLCLLYVFAFAQANDAPVLPPEATTDVKTFESGQATEPAQVTSPSDTSVAEEAKVSSGIEVSQVLTVPTEQENQGEQGVGAVKDAPSLPRLAVVEVVDTTGRKEWQDQLIAYGIADLVSNELYATGRYLHVEDEPEIISQINEMVVQSWMSGKPPEAMPSDAGLLADKLKCEAFCRIKVLKFSTSRIRTIGLVAAGTVTIELTVEITIEEKGGKIFKAMGEGKGVTRNLGVFFSIRDNKIHFDETTVGQAVQQAVRDAVSRLF